MSLFFSELTQTLGGSRYHQGHYFVCSGRAASAAPAAGITSMQMAVGWAAGMVPGAGWGFPSSQHLVTDYISKINHL